MAGKKGQKKHANKTSFTSESRTGITQYQKWTEEKTAEFFKKAYDLAEGGEITLTNIAKELNEYPPVFDYLLEKYPKFEALKKAILKHIENNTYTKALSGEYVPSIAIFGLKNNHGWSDKQEIEHSGTMKTNTTIEIENLNEN